jgi:hypothetical protein
MKSLQKYISSSRLLWRNNITCPHFARLIITQPSLTKQQPNVYAYDVRTNIKQKKTEKKTRQLENKLN